MIKRTRILQGRHIPRDHGRFMDQLGEELGLKTMEDWYKISVDDMTNRGGFAGRAILQNYGNSPYQVLKSIYPQHPWSFWMFERIPRGCWANQKDEKEELSRFVSWISKELRVGRLEDWYRISLGRLRHLVPLSTLSRYPLDKILELVYPNHPWELEKIRYRKGFMKASQRELTLSVEEIFPSSGILP